MMRQLRVFNQSRPGEEPLAVHIGIHSGRVAFANIGSKDYLQYATIGDATNVSARICSAAQSGQILISAETRRRLKRPGWKLRRLPPVAVKGKAEPLELFRVVGAP